MKGLLLKDFYVLNRQMKLYILFILVFAVIPYSYLQLFAVAYAAILPYSAAALDETSHWDLLAGMMPYSIRDLVLSKYIVGWLAALGSSLVAVAASLAERLWSLGQPADPGVVLVCLCIALLEIAFSMPFLFGFGSARGRQIMMFVLVILTCASAGALSNVVIGTTGVLSLAPVVPVLLFLAALALTAVSVPLSLALYRRKRQ